MRILQLTHKPPYPPNDGSSIAIYNMSCGLIENNAELTLLTINTKKHFKPDGEIDPVFKKKSNYQSVYQDTDISLRGAFLNLFSKDSYFVSRFYFKAFADKLISVLKEKQFDVIQLESIFLGDYIPLLRKYSKAKISIRTHNTEHLIWERLIENENNFFKKNYLRIQNERLKDFEEKILKSVDAIIPITDVDKAYFQSWGIEKPYHVSQTGLQLQQYKPDESLVLAQSIFHFGSMDWLPNEEAVLWFIQEVWDLVLAQIPQAKFYVVGRGMSKKVSSLQKANVVIVGKTDSAEKVYHHYDIMIVPLLSGSGMRIKMIEGMAYGKAIVSTTVGAEGIAVRDEKNCLLRNNPIEFAQGVIDLLKIPQKKNILQKEARLFVEGHFDNTKITARLMDFYKAIV